MPSARKLTTHQLWKLAIFTHTPKSMRTEPTVQERRAAIRAQTVKAKEKAEAKRQEENKPAPITAESLFAAKMAERHGTK
jgi:hypothetical protein